jgi:diacylglycerol O-acyltransferase
MASPKRAPQASGEPTPRPINDDRRMSDLEALLWNVDKDPYLSSNFGSVTLLDRAPDLGRLRRRMLRAVQRVPRLHQRVVPAFGRMAPPEWRDDAEFDIDRHLRHLALPKPGTLRQLYDLSTLFVQDPLDRSKPLWEFMVIDGLAGGRAALVQKMHHTITDGEGGIRLSEQFIDAAREVPDIDEIVIEAAGQASTGSVLGSAADTVGHSLRRTIGIVERAAEVAGDSVRHPGHLAGMGIGAVETGRSFLRQMTVTDGHHSPLWSEPSLGRRLETLDVDFDEARRAAKALGGSLNDLFVSGAAAGAGAYHRTFGVEVDEMRIAMPVSTRHDDSAGGNQFVPTRVLVPTGDLDPMARFGQVHDVLSRTKQEKAIAMMGAFAGVANLLPTSALVRLARQQAETVDFATSNVRAAPFELFIGGARIDATYPVGPLAGTAFNLTMMSYQGQLNMGLHADTGMVTDTELLRDLMAQAFADLIAAGG